MRNDWTMRWLLCSTITLLEAYAGTPTWQSLNKIGSRFTFPGLELKWIINLADECSLFGISSICDVFLVWRTDTWLYSWPWSFKLTLPLQNICLCQANTVRGTKVQTNLHSFSAVHSEDVSLNITLKGARSMRKICLEPLDLTRTGKTSYYIIHAPHLNGHFVCWLIGMIRWHERYYWR